MLFILYKYAQYSNTNNNKKKERKKKKKERMNEKRPMGVDIQTNTSHRN